MCIYLPLCGGKNLRNNELDDNDTRRNLQPILHESQISDNLNILTLGGSVTWGAGLSSRDLAFPSLLSQMGPYIVHNLAIRASDPHYPSLCLQSMLRDRESIEFDVIILEFSLNGFNGLSTLIKRLQYRYPNAALIYIHLYSLNISTRQLPDGSFIWLNQPFFYPGPAIQQLLDDIQAYTFIFPKPDEPKDADEYFAHDRHHISENGHQFIASKLVHLLGETSFVKSADDNLDIFKWGNGDQCENWFDTGEIDGFVVEEYEEGIMKSMKDDNGNDNNKFTIEFQKSGSMRIENQSFNTVPVYILYMSARDKYPITNIIIGDKVTSVDPHRLNNHVAEAIPVGWAHPGLNVLSIEPTSDMQEPFRILGIALFGFSYDMNLPFIKFHNVLGNLSNDLGLT